MPILFRAPRSLRLPRRALSRTLFTLALACSLPLAAAPETLDRVVAVVNKSAITEQELEAKVASVTRNMRQQKINPPPAAELRRQVLDRMITDRVLFDIASETGLRIDEVQLDRAVDKIAEQNKLSQVQLRAALERDGVSMTRFREDIRKEMLVTRLREREVNNRVFITDAEVDQFQQQKGSRADQEYRLSHIVVVIPEGATPEQILARQRKMEAASRALAAGTPFAEVTARYSEGNDALNGGSLGWRAEGRLPPAFLEALTKLTPGQYTPILRSPAGFHILQLNEKRVRDNTEIIQQTFARHILVKVNELTSDNDAKNRITQIHERIQNGASFTEQAKLYSEDNSAKKGGDLDWISPGDTVPEFEQAMNALQPGQLSAPVRSPFGWHIIQVVERRTQDVTQERARARIRMELRARKADEQYEEWVRQQRDSAFVELRLEER